MLAKDVSDFQRVSFGKYNRVFRSFNGGGQQFVLHTAATSTMRQHFPTFVWTVLRSSQLRQLKLLLPKLKRFSDGTGSTSICLRKFLDIARRREWNERFLDSEAKIRGKSLWELYAQERETCLSWNRPPVYFSRQMRKQDQVVCCYILRLGIIQHNTGTLWDEDFRHRCYSVYKKAETREL